MKKILTIIFALTLFCLTLTSCDAISGLLGSLGIGGGNTGVTAADLEGVVFEDKTVTYDGSEKNIFATDVPEGVSVVYEGNGKINAGEYTVTAKFYYNDEFLTSKSATLVIKKATLNMSGVSFGDKTVTYDGTEHSIALTGTLPAGVSVKYDGNGKVNAGNYTVTAHFEYNTQNYEAISDMSAILTIKKATLNMSGVSFGDKTVTYDGTEHSIALMGTLPAGVSVKYDGNGKVNAGNYTVTAHFEYNTQNYEAISDMSAILTIKKATLDISAFSFSDKTVTYDGTEHFITLTGTLPYGVSVNYDGNGKVNAGNYTVTAHFEYNTQNYEAISDMSAMLTIKKATYDMSGVSFLDKTVTYSRDEYGISITGELPNGVTVSYEGNGKSAVGTYTVVASFVGDSANYELIPDMSAILTIEPFLVSGLSFNDQTFYYDGEEKSIFITGTVPTDVKVIYEGNGKTNAGSYVVTVRFEPEHENYGEFPILSATMTINKATYDMSGVNFSDKTVTYDGIMHSIECVGALPAGVTVSYVGNGKIDVGTYTVVASFVGDSANYELIPDMSATLTIERFYVTGLSFNDQSFYYDGQEKSIFITGTVPADVEVIYEGNGKIDVGCYVVTVRFETENKNYGEFPVLTATMTISKKTYTPVFNDATVSFDAKEHSIFVEGELPDGITVEYIGNGVVIPGTYTVTAVFTTDGRYEEVENITATLVIELGSYKTPASDFEYSKRSDGTLQITGYKGIDCAIVIPEYIDDTKVTSIATEAFKNNRSIIYIYISDEIINIGNNAFAFSTLETVRFGTKIEVIGASAFKGTNIKNADLPATLTTIGSGAFASTNLESITLPFIGGSHTTSNSFIGYIFGARNYSANATNVPATLKSVTLNGACTKIPAYAFWGCSGIEEIVIGNSVKTIGNSAFSGCSSLRSIYIPASVSDIPANANVYDSPFYNTAYDMLVVFESVGVSNMGQCALYVNDAKKAISIFGKSYSDYLANKDGSYREFDSSDSTLLGIQVNGSNVSEFSSSKLEYSVTLPITSGIKINYTASSFGASVEYTEPTASNGNVATIKVTSADGSSITEYKLNFTFTGTTTAEIVNKDGTDATVTFVIDDGEKQTATFAKTMLEKYSGLSLSFGVKTKDIATLKTHDPDGDGIPEYVIVNGKYQYDINQDNVNFWNDILSLGRSEIVSHTHTHVFWGLDDEGGSYTYVDNKLNINTSAIMPEGNSSKELYAAKQILEDLFSAYVSKNGTAISLIDAGIGVRTDDVTIGGIKYPSYKTFFKALWKSAYQKGDLISIRSTFGATYDPNLDLSTKVITPSRYDTMDERFNTPGYMVEHYNANPEGVVNDDISNWTAYIDAAIAMNGWAGFCIHDIRPASASSSPNGHRITEDQADKLFAYASEKNIWVATYTAASMYYAEWSTASVSSVYENGSVKVTLTDRENDDVFTEALTVKVSVPATWTSAISGSEILEIHKNSDGSAYVYVNIVPDTGAVTISAN